MRYIFIAFFVIVLFASLINTEAGRRYFGLILNSIGVSGQKGENEIKREKIFQDLKDKEEDLAFLRRQIGDLKRGLQEMPDKNQNGYFRDLLKGLENKESILSHQTDQNDEMYQEMLQNPSLKEAAQASRFYQTNQENIQNQTQRLNDLLETNQLRAQMQMQSMSDLMEQNQRRAEVSAQRMNDILELNQMRMESLAQRMNDANEQNQMHLEDYNQRN